MIIAEHNNEKGGCVVTLDGDQHEISQEFYAICKALLQSGAEIETMQLYINELKKEQ